MALSFLFGNPAKAESVGTIAPVIENDLENRVLVAATNTALGAVLGCIGAEISGNGCVDGLWKGSVGGAVTYAGMELGSYNAEVPFTGLAGRQIVSLGSSMTSNAMFSRELLQRYETDFGPIVFSIDRNDGFNLSIMPIATHAFFYNLTMGNNLNMLESLEDGTFVFERNNSSTSNSGINYVGNTTSTIPAHLRGYNSVRSHENIHTYQPSRLRFADELVPQLRGLRYGAEILNALIALPGYLFEGNAYYYTPLELEADSMERP